MRIENRPHAKDIELLMIRARAVACAFGTVLGLSLATPVLAASNPTTRLVSCGIDSCLLVSGHRDSAAAQVQINGHPLDVEGGRNWRVRLPVATVRDWSVPFARRIEVTTHAPTSRQTLSQQAVLPIGLLGHVPDLASLVITVH